MRVYQRYILNDFRAFRMDFIALKRFQPFFACSSWLLHDFRGFHAFSRFSSVFRGHDVILVVVKRSS